jgi:hypothetical protein
MTFSLSSTEQYRGTGQASLKLRVAEFARILAVSQCGSYPASARNLAISATFRRNAQLQRQAPRTSAKSLRLVYHGQRCDAGQAFDESQLHGLTSK